METRAIIQIGFPARMWDNPVMIREFTRLRPDVFRFRRFAWLGILALGLGLPEAKAQSSASAIDFNQDIRPILSDNCFACHGPDANTREAELRLDLRDDAIMSRDGVAAIVPGNPEESEVLARIFSADEDDLMPPPESGKVLNVTQKQLIRSWIAQGAPYQEHWSFQPVRKPEVPVVDDSQGDDWTDIDRFLKRRMESVGVGFSEDADPVTLVRRLSFDLLGLPPQKEWIEAYSANPSTATLSSLVNEMLASRHFGERMAVFWLDLVRYADTIGYHSDNHKEVSGFRDYVIHSFNENKPYDQFTREQLAGDWLDDNDPWVKIASGYNRLLQTTEEGGSQAKEYRAIYAADRVRNVSSVWLGTTLGCAQCHDHKYDPFTTKDFYSMAAFFADIDEPAVGKQQPNFKVPDAQLESEYREVSDSWHRQRSLVLDFNDAVIGTLHHRPQGLVNLTSPSDSRSLGFDIAGIAVSIESAKSDVSDDLKDMISSMVLPEGAVRWVSSGAPDSSTDYISLVLMTESSPESLSVMVSGRTVVDDFPLTEAASSGQPLQILLPSAELGKKAEISLVVKGDGRVGIAALGYVDAIEAGSRFDIDALKIFTEEFASRSNGIQTIEPISAESIGGADLQPLGDGSYLSTGTNPPNDTYIIRVPLSGGKPDSVHGVFLEALRHESLANKSLSRANGNFVLTEFEAWHNSGDQRIRVDLGKPSASFEQGGWPIANTLDAKKDTGWAVQGWQIFEDRQAWFPFANPLKPLSNDDHLEIVLRHDSAHKQHNIGRFRLSVATREGLSLESFNPVPPAVERILASWRGQGDIASADLWESARYAVAHSSHFFENRKVLEQLTSRRDDISKSFREVLVVQRTDPRMTRVLPRGNWMDDSGEVVEPAIPAFLPTGHLASKSMENRRLTRLDLADWIMDPENPLTSRTMVNRIWKIFFGYGLSRDLGDLGGQGQPPTHPDLLDYLASDFRDGGWDVKALVRKMVLSKAYRQTSIPTDWLAENDASNRLFARQSRFRMDAEFVRDIALSVSGLLVDEVGGGNARPYQPAGYWQHLNFPRREYQADTGDGLYRRGLYTYWCRTFLHPSLLAFDAPSREECTAERSRSNTPQQALVLLNDPSYVEAAKALAGQFHNSGKTVEKTIQDLFERALSRQPDRTELNILVDYYQSEADRYSRDVDEGRKVLAVGELRVPAESPQEVAHLAALMSVARSILNLYETTARF